MCNFKKLGVLVAIFALSAIGAANASAAQFTASAVGSLTGKATSTHVFTTNAGQVKCTTAEPSGEIKSTASTEWHITVNLKSCTAFGFANVHYSPLTLLITADGTVHIKGGTTINTTLRCHQTIHPQSVGTASFINEPNGLIITFHLTGIHYTAGGSLCGMTGTNGTITGDITLARVGGGSVSHHP